VQQPAPAPANTPAIRVETKPQTAVSQPLATPQPAAVATPQPAPAAPQAAPAKPQPAPAAPQPAAITASNTPITELQNLLAKRGFYNGKVDGVLSGETRNAIVRAQNFYTIAPADGAPSNKLVESLSKDTFISSESN
jgi:peptidoglycan hydrolase-like protein with peptidoglycan-binding domain